MGYELAGMFTHEQDAVEAEHEERERVVLCY
jgi:hypothetical protein